MYAFVRRGLLIAALIAPATAWSVGMAQVSIDNFSFGPGILTIGRGDSVTWMNQDDIPHSIVFTGLGVRSNVLDTDKIFTYQFDRAGTFSYVCGLHPQMHGQVVVK
jgi:plastocyanin